MSIDTAADLLYDPLTGVYSRQMLRQWLPEGIENAQRHQYTLAVMMVDIDYFKSINDAFGHVRGDDTLTEFAQRLQSLVRASDMVFRYGGDEFIILLPHTTNAQAVELAQRLIEAMRSTRFGSNPSLSLSMSLGIATYPEDGSSPEAVFEAADQRHYIAKRSGRGRAISQSPPQSAPPLFVEPGRLIEQDNALLALNRFLDIVPAQGRGALRISGPAGAGHSRFLAEVRKIARLRGYAVMELQGQPALKSRLFSVLLEALGSNPLAPGQHIPPVLGSDERGEKFITALRQWIEEKGNIGLLVTMDNIPQIDRGSASFLRQLFFSPDFPRLGLVYADGGVTSRQGFPRDIPVQESTSLKPLSRDGVQIWVRQALQWEAPRAFLDWLHLETEGLPGRLQRGMTLLVRQEMIKPGLHGWEIAGDYAEYHLSALLEQYTRGIPLNMPSGLSDFVGREEEIAQLKQQLSRDRLVILLGTGGIGKTRLALQTAAECSEQFNDGACYVPLARIENSAWLVSAIAEALHYTFFGPSDPKELLLAYLRNKEMLLVLDNFEHLLNGAQVVSEILEQAPGVHLIITSRERLNLPGETVFDLGGLPIPGSDQVKNLESYAAVQLFINSAQRFQTNFSLEPEDWLAVVQICQMVEGIPLGIEMAASWVQSFRPPRIVEEIRKSLSMLANGQPELSEPYRRMRATFDSFWNNLSASEQATLCQLSVLTGEFSGEAARRIADASLFFLEALVGRSILRRNPQGRYHMHELLRQYTAEYLEQQPGMHAQALNSYCRFYLSLVISQKEKLLSDGQALVSLQLESENLRTAWYLALEHGLTEWIKRAALPLSHFYRLANLWREGELAFETAIQWAEGGAQNEQPAALEALGSLLVAQAGLLNDRAAFAGAAQAAQRAGAIAENSQDGALLAAAYLEWGNACWHQIDYDQARALLTRALELAQANQLVHIETECLRNLGLLFFFENRYPEALAYLDRSLELCLQTGNQRGESASLNTMGTIHLISGDTEKARSYYQQSQSLLNNLGDQRGEGRLINNLGCVHQGEGDNYRALAYFEQALRVDQEIGDRWGISTTLTNLGITYHRLGELARARTVYEQAIQVCGEIGQWAGGAGGLSNLGLLHYHLGEYETAGAYQLQAAQIAREHNNLVLLSYPLARLGQVYLAQKRYAEATQCCQEAIQYREADHRPDLTLDPLACLARLSLAQGDIPAALAYCERLLEQCQGVISDDDTDDPFWIYLTLWDIFEAAQDGRAMEHLHLACRELNKRAAAIADPDIRLSFLQNLPANRLIYQLCRAI